MTGAVPEARQRKGWLAARDLAWFALAGVIVYVGIDVLLRFLQPHYSLVYNAESDYGRGPWSWVMDLNFLLLPLGNINSRPNAANDFAIHRAKRGQTDFKISILMPILEVRGNPSQRFRMLSEGHRMWVFTFQVVVDRAADEFIGCAGYWQDGTASRRD